MPNSVLQNIAAIPGSAQVKRAMQALFGSVRLGVRQYSVTFSPASVAANTTVEQTVTVTGLLVGDFVFINKPTTQAGIGICGARVSAANQIAIAFNNNTAGAIVPTASESYRVFAFTPTELTA